MSVRVVQRELWASGQPTARLCDFINPQTHGLFEADWWKYLGALLLMDGGILLAAFNSPHSISLEAYLVGKLHGLELGQCVWSQDPLLCPEALIIGTVASRGMVTKGTVLYVDLFPCPTCSRIYSKSGIKRLLYRSGYPHAPEVESLKSGGVEIFQVK